MFLKEIIEVLQKNQLLIEHSLYENQKVNRIHYDSRKVKPGDAFLCIKGEKTDGHLYINQAIKNGAIAIITDNNFPSLSVPVINTNSTKESASLLANEFYGYPTKSMNVIGVTGTNGKTTTTQLIEQILLQHKLSCGLIGTIDIRYNGKKETSSLTTPLALDLQEIFYNMKNDGVSHVAMEVSSHALALGRVNYVKYKTAVFTNLSQDHLDYHKTMDEYLKAKSLLISGTDKRETPEFVVLNRDDSSYEYLKNICKSKLITYGIDNDCDVRATNIQLTSKGTKFTVKLLEETLTFETKLVGKFNVYNILAVICVCMLEGMELYAIQKYLKELSPVRGRMEIVDKGQPYLAIVDYAHTPDGLENVLSTLKHFVKGKIHTVVGCGGDRDKTKRPIMASIAEKYSDKVFLTSDNPRTEDPQAILDDMLKGIHTDNHVVIVNREEAIEESIKGLQEGDCVIVAGKGHETYQIIGTEKMPFDDREILKKYILL